MGLPSSASVPAASRLLQVCPATGWKLVARDQVAWFKIGDSTRIVVSWGDSVPPRQGRPPSIEELMCERALGERPPKRRMPEGVHRGRPRLHRPELLGE
jgi:hypothetical protein